MKNFKLLLLALVVVDFASCKKTEVPNQTSTSKFVTSISGSINTLDGDVTLKSLPAGLPTSVNRAYYLYSNNPAFYTSGLYEKVDGREFILGSAPQVFWSTPGNNPATTLGLGAVYSNYTPIEQVRMVTRTLAGDNKAIYLGIFDYFSTC